MKRLTSVWVWGWVLLLVFIGAGCRQDMHDQSKVEPLEKSTFFADNRSARPIIDGTVARGQLNENPLFHTGKTDDGRVAESFPMEVTTQLMERGQERYNIFCAPCHDGLGTGQGMIVRRGYRRPPSMHIDRLRQAPPGYFFDIMTNGFGSMPKYNVQIPPADRWAIAAYIRALQYSQRATIDDVPENQREKLDNPNSQSSEEDQQHE